MVNNYLFRLPEDVLNIIYRKVFDDCLKELLVAQQRFVVNISYKALRMFYEMREEEDDEGEYDWEYQCDRKLLEQELTYEYNRHFIDEITYNDESSEFESESDVESV